MLDEKQIRKIAQQVATANLTSANFTSILSSTATNSQGNDALRITIVIKPGAEPKIKGDAALNTLVQIQDRLRKAGEERFPIVEYATKKSLANVAILNPEHLFQQADFLITGVGRPRQVAIRRAISTAYYGVFHAIIAAATDQFVGVTNRHRNYYGLVYRSVDHKWLRELCKEVQKPTMVQKFRPYEPRNGFGPNIAAFAVATIELQEKGSLQITM